MQGQETFDDIFFGDTGFGMSTERGTVTLLPDPSPRELWCPIISVDDHVLEPPGTFVDRVPAADRDLVPYVVTDDAGLPGWVVDGERLPLITQDSAVGRPQSEWTFAPAKFEEFRTGTYDPEARLADMDLNGISASLNFPSALWGFAGTRLNLMKDERAALLSVRAYNDWMIDEWCGACPSRFIPCQIPWLRDPVLGAEEVRKNHERGFKAVSFSENPEVRGFPHLYSEHWDPFFRACEETGTVINLHIGSSGSIPRPSSVSPMIVTAALFPLNGLTTVVDWIFTKIPLRFPDLKVVLSEAGVSWVPMIIERLTKEFRDIEGQGMIWDPSDPTPVELLHRNFWFTSIEDPSAFRMLDIIGEDKVMLEMDYPHPDTSWPDTQALAQEGLAHLDPKVIMKLCFGNASRLYRHEPPAPDLIARSVVGGMNAQASSDPDTRCRSRTSPGRDMARSGNLARTLRGLKRRLVRRSAPAVVTTLGPREASGSASARLTAPASPARRWDADLRWSDRLRRPFRRARTR